MHAVFYGALFNSICNGGCLLLSESATFLNDAKKCTILPATPALLGAIADASPYSNIHTIFIGGETSSPSLIKKWCAPHRRVWNGYGPTETTISLTMGELRPAQPISLGTPIRNSKIVLLNPQLEESDEGEIAVGGSAVLAVGYYNDPERTNDRFIQWHGERMYLTGDLAKRAGSELIFLGRKDQMVKNRGFLINLEAEVLPAILSQPGVDSATAVMHEKRLVAFVTPSSINGAQLQQRMRSAFDLFIVPDEIYPLDELPQTTNGKIDRRFLLQQLSRNHVSPTPTQDSPTWSLLALQDATAECLGTPVAFVNVSSSFTDLGGNSLLGIKLISILQQRGLVTSATALFSLPSLAEVSETLEAIDAQSPCGKVSATSHDGRFERVSGVAVATGQVDGTTASRTSFAITDAQKGMITSSLKEPLAGYLLATISLHASMDDIDANAMSQAWKSVLADYEVFRLSFELPNSVCNIANEYLHNWETIPAPKSSLAAIIERESEAMLQQARSNTIEDNIFTPVNLFRLFLVAEKSSVLLWLVHHSLIDGWSVSEILRQVKQELYHGRHEVPKKQFSAYANSLTKPAPKRQREAEKFWTGQLRKCPEGTGFNIWNHVEDCPKKEVAIAAETIGIDLSLAHLNVAAQSLGVSSAVVLHTAWATLLSNYAGTDDVVFAGVFSGRSFPGDRVAEVVGPIINTCPFRIRIPASGLKYDMIRSVKSTLLQIADHQWSASPMLQQLVPGSMAQLFQTALFLEYDIPINDTAPGPGGHHWSCARQDWPEFGLTLQVQQEAGNIMLRAVYKTGQYPETSVISLLDHFRNILFALMDPTVTSMHTVKEMMLTPLNRLKLVQSSPLRHSSYSGVRSLKQLFEDGAGSWPDAVALDSSEKLYTYNELNRVGNLVASLIRKQVRPTDVVAVLSDGSKHWLICALAVVKAGATYLPLDTKLPSERMKIMMETADARLCVYPNSACHELRPSLPGARLLAEDPIDAFKMAADQDQALENLTGLDDYAYIMFTSGSTGAPKGVRITNRAVLSHLSFEPARLHARPGRRHAQIFSPGFDVSIAELFGTLCYGATLVLKDPANPIAHLGRVNATMATPSLLSTLPPTQFQNLDTIYLIGEDVSQALCDTWAGGRTVYNFYGPCECTIAATFTQLVPGNSVTIGKPIPRVGAYILDKYMRPAPVGVIGEIYLSGLQVMEGYIGMNTEIITKRAFIPDPFAPGQRMYRTGDLGTWTSAMEIKFLGRADHQVKVRGYRVELDEIEHLLLKADDAVGSAAVMVIQDAIYAFVTPETAVESDLINILHQRLPSYAVPQRIFTLSSLPLTANQKLDRTTLADMVSNVPKGQKQALSKMEQLIEQKWSEIIGIEESAVLGPDDDFLAIGGNSLRQISVARTVCAELGHNIPLGLFIHNTRMGTLAKAIEEHIGAEQTNDGVGFDVFPSTASREASYLEKMRFAMQKKSKTPSSLNVAYTIAFEGNAQVDLLAQAIRTVMSSSDIFRTCFSSQGRSLETRLLPGPPDILQVPCLSDTLVSDLIDTPFDLEKGPLTRIAVAAELKRIQMVFVQHHIITDQTSIEIFLRETCRIYSSLASGMDALIKSPRPYADWAGWKNRQMEKPVNTECISFWKSHLRNVSKVANRYPRPPEILQHFAHSLPLRLGKPASGAGLGFFLGATALAWGRVFHLPCAYIAIPWIDRTEPGTGDMYGLFLDALPVCIPLRQADDLHTIVARSTQSVKGVLSHALPSPRIKEIVKDSSLFDVVVVYNKTEDRITAGVKLQGISVTATPKRAVGSKYPILIEFIEEKDHIRLEMEYFQEAVDRKAISQLESALVRLLN